MEQKRSALEDRLFIKEVVLYRNIQNGNMEIKSVLTNKGSFNIHEDINVALDREAFNNFYDYIRSVVSPSIREFLKQEEEEEGELLE